MISAEVVTAMKLKIKFSSKRIEVDHETEQQLSTTNGLGHNFSVVDSQSKQKSSMPSANKRGPSAAIEVQQSKRQKMDRGVTQQCSNFLKELMGHHHGWVFNQPVDPNKLNIPDYFTVIKNPMDLGTIKSKLNKNQYGSIEDFASDIRLTFSNAMLYNPPANAVHIMAKELNQLFDTWWKSLEDRWNCERSKFGNGKVPVGRTKGNSVTPIGRMTENSVTHQSCPKTPPLHGAVLPKRSKPSVGKVIKSSLGAQPAKVKISKSAEHGTSKSLEQKFYKGTDSDGKLASGSVNKKASLNPIAFKCGTCGRNECRCSLPCDSMHTSSDISSERSLTRDHHACSSDTSKLDYKIKCMLTSELSKSDPDSEGDVSALDDDIACPSSQLTTPAAEATSGGGWQPSTFDVTLSPSKALRAAFLKNRFADTILKAQHKTLLDNGDKADPVKLQQEKERLEKKQQEEKARIEAEIRAAEAASKKREELELKQKRLREREAARVALQKMERTVDLDRNLEVLKELEMLCGCPLSYNIYHGSKGAKGIDSGSPLERLGLFIKFEFGDDDCDYMINGDGEEGEILS